jgi:hypothetical protein
MAFEFTAFSVGSQFCRAFAGDTWPTWALVAVGVGGIIYAARTLGAIRHEAEIAKEIAAAASLNAAAANLNAKAVIDSERAWVVAEIPCISDIAIGQPLSIIWTVKNGGKTTARVMEKGENFSVQPSLTSLPEQPHYRGPTLWPDALVLAPNSTLSCALRVPDPDTWQPIEDGYMILFVYGFVKYRDVFEREHETRYIFRYDASKAFSIDGKLEYSKAT